MPNKIAVLAIAYSFMVQSAVPCAFAAAPKATTKSTKEAPKPAPKSAPGKPMPGWIIKQTMQYQGDIEIKACDQGAVVVTRNLCVYMKPTSGDVFIANQSNHTITKADKSLWMDENRMNNMLVKDVKDPKVLKQFSIEISPPRMVKGYKCNQHWAAAYRPDHRFWFWWEYWTPTDIKVPKELSTRWRTLLHLPEGDGIPFEASRHFQQNHKSRQEHVLLKTTLVKKTTLVASDIEPPKSYKQVKDEIEALMGSHSDKDELDEIFEDTKKKK